ncbi:MAG: hypothetical protein U0263_37590 [Polyangiaceae bacterium]
MGIAFEVEPRRNARGVVVDLCRPCAGLEPHWLCDKGGDSVIVCFRCFAERDVDPSRFASVVPADSAATLPIAQGLEITHPKLAGLFGHLDRARAAGAPAELVERVEALAFAEVDAESWAQSLAGWESLDGVARSSLGASSPLAHARAGSPVRPSRPIDQARRDGELLARLDARREAHRHPARLRVVFVRLLFSWFVGP